MASASRQDTSADRGAQEPEAQPSDDGVFSVDVVTPAGNVLRLHHVSAAETVMSLRQLLEDIPQVTHYTCYDLVAEPVPLPAHAPNHGGTDSDAHNSAERAAAALAGEASGSPAGVLLTDNPSAVGQGSDEGKPKAGARDRSGPAAAASAASGARGGRKAESPVSAADGAGGDAAHDDNDDDEDDDDELGMFGGGALDPCASVPGALPHRALNDFLDLAEYPHVCSGRSRLRMTLRPYDVRQIRLHLRRLREALAHPPAPQPSVSVVATHGEELPCVEFAPAAVAADEDGEAEDTMDEGADNGGSASALLADAPAAARPTGAPSEAALEGAASSAGGEPAPHAASPDADADADADAEGSAARLDDAEPSAAELLRSVASAQESLRSALEEAPPVPVPVPRRLQSIYSPPPADAVAGPVTLLRVMQPADSGPKCLRSVSLSGWNPPPPARAALGDLLYLDVVTLDRRDSLPAELARSLRDMVTDEDASLLAAAHEAHDGEAGTVLHITATASGLYVNRTNGSAFDPEPLSGDAATHSSTLVGLLVRASPAFAKAYSALMRRAADAAASAPSSTLAPWETLFNMSVRPPPSLRAAALGEAIGGGGMSPPKFSGTFASIGEGYAFARGPWLVDPTGGRASRLQPWDGARPTLAEPASFHGSALRRPPARGRMSSALHAGAHSQTAGGSRRTPGKAASAADRWWERSDVAWSHHRHDLNRAEDELGAAFGMDERGALRDWNEEYQSCRMLPTDTLPQRVVRARALTKVVVDFVEAATRGALAIARGHVPPLNPTDDPSTFVYVFNSIFFSLGMDETLRRRHRRKRLRAMRRRARRVRAADAAAAAARAEASAARDAASKDASPESAARAAAAEARAVTAADEAAAAAAAGGPDDALADAASMVPSNHDLHGVRALNRVDVTGLHTLLTVVVDISGRRVVAQSIIPGILQGEQASSLVYGSTDNGATVASEPRMHALVRQACEELGIAERIFRPAALLPGASGSGASKVPAAQAPGSDPAAAARAAADADPAAPATPGADGAEASSPGAATAGAGPEAEAEAASGVETRSWASTDPAPLCGPLECKGIVGSDGRRYVLDMVRCTPRDPIFYGAKRAARAQRLARGAEATAAAAAAAAGAAKQGGVPAWADIGAGDSDSEDDGIGSCYTALLRPELIEAYKAHVEGAAPGEPGAPPSGVADGAPGGAVPRTGPPAASEGAGRDAAAETVPGDGPRLRLNVNAFTRFARATGTAEEVERDEDQVRNVGVFLLHTVLPAFVAQLTGPSNSASSVVLDGEQLTERMHAMGINVRYLGAVARRLLAAESAAASPPTEDGVAAGRPSPALLELVEAEMVARVARRRLNAIIRDDPRTRAAPAVAVAAFLNALLGAPEDAPSAGGADAADRTGAQARVAGGTVPGIASRDPALAGGLDTLSQAQLAVKELGVTRDAVWAAVEAGVRRHFGYELVLWRNGGFDDAAAVSRAVDAAEAARKEAESAQRTVRAALEMAAKAYSEAAGSGAAGGSHSADAAAAALDVARARADAADREATRLQQAADRRHSRLSRCHRVPLLRRLCQKAGVQIVAREHALGWGTSVTAPAAETSAAADSADAASAGTGAAPRSGKKGGRGKAAALARQRAAAEQQEEAEAAHGWSWFGGSRVGGVAQTPFRVSDVAGLVPVVKHCLPDSLLEDASALHEQGRALLGEGRLQEAYHCVQEALLLLYQVCGAAHTETAACCSTLAVILWHAGDKLGAVAQQQRATVLMELLRGVDHHETAVAHSNLAYFLGGCNEMQASAVHMRRALLLMDAIGGPSGTESVATWLKLGMIYQDGLHAVMAVACFREALARCEHDPSQAAACLHALAVAHSVGGGFREALAHEQRALALLQATLGEGHERAVEAARWARQFSRKAQALDSALFARLRDGDARAPGAARDATAATLARRADGGADAPAPAAKPQPAAASAPKTKRRRGRKGNK
ncbi:hypothetical protein FNF31_08027 [Cafeteria roenbergensis]|uniref:Clu domain-containing protein n=3 Tax=Cafeteria roenbergensis TaxID=33653 RepID=A0A5A8BYM6_CAFRO|nr:hypothetical protein FNF31_08027 [Cafeteria roenbergensis]KAA0160497.1 hypothetical protein FNF28_05453 [Cafeteria roenbergensis]